MLNHLILDCIYASHEKPPFQDFHISDSQYNTNTIYFFPYSRLSISKSSKIKVCLRFTYVCWISDHWHKALEEQRWEKHPLRGTKISSQATASVQSHTFETLCAFNLRTLWPDTNTEYLLERFLLQSLCTWGMFVYLNMFINAFEVSGKLKYSIFASFLACNDLF